MGKEPPFGQNSLLFTSDILIFIKASLLYIALFECVILFVSPCPFISEPSLKKEKSEVSIQTGSPTGSSPNVPWSSQIMDPNICQVFCLGTPGQWPVSRYSALLLTSTWRSMTTTILTQRMNLWKDSWRSTDLAHADIGKLPSCLSYVVRAFNRWILLFIGACLRQLSWLTSLSEDWFFSLELL